MVDQSILNAEKFHLSELLKDIQRCVYFLDTSSQKLIWPLTAALLDAQKKNVVLSEAIAAINERFAKLLDTLATAMRHACILAGGPPDSFLKELCFYEKTGTLELVESWQLCRAAHNLAAHDYKIKYTEIADHFNTLKLFTPLLYMTSFRFLSYYQKILGIEPKQAEFMAIVKIKQVDENGMTK